MLERLWKFFASLKPAAFIFSALVISTLAGSFIIQRPNAQEGQIERAYSPETVKIFEFFGFFDLFHSPWFVFLIFLLAVNVICASIEMWPRHVKMCRKRDPLLPEAALRNQPFFREGRVEAGRITREWRDAAVAAFKKIFGRAPEIHEEGGRLHFHVNKMRYGYFGVYVVHAGLIIIMAGGIWGSIDGFEGQMSLMEGETSSKVYLRNAVRRNKRLDFSVRCRDIRIETYEDGSPKDYFSDLEVLDGGGQVVLAKTVQVNEPLTYGGISFYQANYGKRKTNEERYYALAVVDAKTGKETKFRLPDDGTAVGVPGMDKKLSVSDYNENPVMPTEEGPVGLGETLNLKLTGGAREETVTLFKDYPEIDGLLRQGAAGTFRFDGLREDYELREVTGLQVARDPGAPVVFFGCAVLLVGIAWAFFTSHQKLWLTVEGTRALLAGRTYRNPASFLAKCEKLAEALSAISEAPRRIEPEAKPRAA